MGRLTDRQKLDRALGFLVGVSHPRVREVLGNHGFDAEQEGEGWQRLRRASSVFFAAAAEPALDETLVELDRWENTWLPVAQATLRRNHPKIERKLFLNLSQTSGPTLIIVVQLFLERVEELRRARDSEAPAALALLAKRGLTQSVLADARKLTQAAKGLGRTRRAAPAPDTRSEEVARLWDFYLEWSVVARTVIQERQLLQLLGFGTTKRKAVKKQRSTRVSATSP